MGNEEECWGCRDPNKRPNVSLSDEEIELARKRLGREPNDIEWAMLDVMWSEHCSYKSSRKWLKLFPTDGKNVLLGVGDDCGIVKFDDKWGIAIGMESHNHPSAIEPVAGAATGIGGIVRDIISKGAKPIACIDPLRLGDIKHDERSKYLFENIIKGIADYGNCLAGDERVVLKNSGHVEDIEIGQYIDSMIPADMGDVRVSGDFQIDALSFDRETGNISWKPVTRLFRRKVGALMEVSTTMGRKIKVSETHPFIVYNGGQWMTKRVTDLQKGDELPIMTGLPHEKALDSIDLLSCLRKTHLYSKLFIRFKNSGKYEKKLRPALLKIEQSADKRCGFFKDGHLNASKFLKLEKASGITIPRDEVTLHYAQSKCNNIPAKIKINEDLARLMGYYLAEGCLSKNGNTYKIIWTFSKKEREYTTDVCRVLEKLGVRFSVYTTGPATQIRASSVILGTLFGEILKTGASAPKKRIPKLFLDQPKHIRFEILKGLFRGDGSAIIHKNNQVRISFAVTSRELQHQVVLLLQDLGVVPSTYVLKQTEKLPGGRKRKAKVINDLNAVEIHNHDDVLKLAGLFENSLSKKMKTALSKHTGNFSFPRYERIGENFAVVKVRDVRKIEREGYVYDFEVADTHTFVMTGGLITHNCIGVPTIGGEAEFDKSFNRNPLVNVVCIGLVDKDRIVHGSAPVAGDTMMLIGSKTGRDGIHGVTFASEELNDSSHETSRPAVQIEDPFSEKLLIDSFGEIFLTDAVRGCKDLGGGGFTCATSEIVYKGGKGALIDMDRIHLREPDMEPWEVILSETQERMMLVVKKGHEEEVENILDKWGVPHARIGIVTDDGRYVVKHKGSTIVNMPTQMLGEGPLFDRRFDPIPKKVIVKPKIKDLKKHLISLLKDPNVASKKWIYEQYDNEVQARTVIKPGQDGSVTRITEKEGVVLGTGCNSHHCALDPHEGAKGALAEAVRNVIAVGGEPLALVDCLNFGNPEKPKAFWQFKTAVEGLAEAAKAFEIPVVSGNVSFYNESDGKPIEPSPVVTVLGKVSLDKTMTMGIKGEGDDVILIGETKPELGEAPKVSLETEKKVDWMVLRLVENQSVNAAHDLSKGGLAVGLAMMAFKREIGFEVDISKMSEAIPETEKLFSESHGRFVVVTKYAKGVLDSAEKYGVKAQVIGKTGGDKLSYGPFSVSIKDAKKAWENGLDELII